MRRSEEHTSELQSHRDLHSFPTRRSSDLRGDLLARMTRFGFSARAAIAATIGAASAAARFGDATTTGANRGERERLAPLPLAALRLPHETVAALARLGLKRIGDILDLPRSPLA